MEGLLHDLIQAIRSLRRSFTFTIVTVTILTLGIGANTAIFSVLNAVLLRPLPVREPSELVHLFSVYPGEPRQLGFPWVAYEHYRDNNHVFAHLIAVAPARFEVTLDRHGVESLQAQYVSGNFFAALGVRPVVGRLITPPDDVVGSTSAAVAVMSWSTWQSRFAGDPGIVGRSVVVDGVPVTVVGVAPSRFSGVITGYTPVLWLPAAAEAQLKQPSGRASGMLAVAVVGRLRPGTSIAEAEAEMRVLDRWRIDQMAARSNDPQTRNIRMDLASARAGITPMRDEVAGPLLLIMAIVGLLLLLASTNVASMVLARGAARRRELAVRVSLGASPSRLVRQALAESLLMAIGGGIAGTFVGVAGARVLARIFVSGRRPLPGLPEWTLDTGVDANVLVFTAAAGIVTGLLSGLAPAVQAFAATPMTVLRANTSGTELRWHRHVGTSLVVVQIAISIVVLSAASLFARHLSELKNVGAGFISDSVLLVSLDPAKTGQTPVELSRLYGELLGRLETIPGVESATLSGMTPIHGAGASRFVNVEGYTEDPSTRRFVAVNWVAPKYFQTFGTPLVAGRDVMGAGETGPPVAIINQSMARHYFGETNPLGRHFTFDNNSRRYEIVGVVGDAKYYNMHDPAPRTVYLDAFQDAPGRSHQFALRTSVPPLRVAAEVRSTAQDVVKNVTVSKVTTFEDQVDASLVNERLIAALSNTFAAVATTLAALGLYGLLAFTVVRRTSEIGIRMALGATPGDVIRLVAGGAAGLVGAGMLAGAPVAFWIRRVAEGLIPNLPSEMAPSFALGMLILTLAAALAAYLPARRATRVDPVEALRHS